MDLIGKNGRYSRNKTVKTNIIERNKKSKAIEEVENEFRSNDEEKPIPLEDIKQKIEAILKLPVKSQHQLDWRDPRPKEEGGGRKERHLKKAGIHTVLLGLAGMVNRQIEGELQPKIKEVIDRMMEDIKNTKGIKSIDDIQVERARNLGNLIIGLIDENNKKSQELLKSLEESFEEKTEILTS